MSTFTNIGAIVRKEWQHYFGSPIAYAALFTWNLLFAVFFQFALTYFLEVSMNPGGGMPPKPNINEWIAGLNGRLLPFGWAKLAWSLFGKPPP